MILSCNMKPRSFKIGLMCAPRWIIWGECNHLWEWWFQVQVKYKVDYFLLLRDSYTSVLARERLKQFCGCFAGWPIPLEALISSFALLFFWNFAGFVDKLASLIAISQCYRWFRAGKPGARLQSRFRSSEYSWELRYCVPCYYVYSLLNTLPTFRTSWDLSGYGL